VNIFVQWRREAVLGGAGRTGRHLHGAAKGRKLYKKNSRENSDCEFHMCLRATTKKQRIADNAYLSSARSAITLGRIETYML